MPQNKQIQVRRDTAANWTSVNPVLAAGEAGYETNTGLLKYGDGATAYNSLAYFTAGGAGTVTSVSVVTANGVSGSVATSTTTPAITITLGAITPTSVNGTTATEIGYVSGVTSSIQTQLNGKQASLGYTAENQANKENTTLDNSATKYPTNNLVKTYVDGIVVGLLDYRGGYDASPNTYPATGGSGTAGAVMKGDMWVISVAGTLGGNAIQIGDSIIANVDSPGQTAGNWNTLNSNVSYVPEDAANKVTSINGSSTDTQYPSAKLLYDQLALKAGNGANTDITSVLLNQSGLVVKGATSNALTIRPNETLTAGRTLNIVTGDSDRTLTMTGNASITGTNTGDQTVFDGGTA